MSWVVVSWIGIAAGALLVVHCVAEARRETRHRYRRLGRALSLPESRFWDRSLQPPLHD